MLFILEACQENDICTGDLPDTPHLVIEFYDYDNPQFLKPTESFNAKALGADKFYYEDAINDTIAALPLKTDATETTYELIMFQQDSATNQQQIDTLKFTYTPNEVYVDRACGFKDEFLDFDTNLLPPGSDSGNWIKAFEVQQPNIIKNEKDPHLFIYF